MTTSDLGAISRAAWWLVLLRGILLVLLGLFALFAPGSALLALVWVFGAYAIVDGVVAVAAGVRHRSSERHWVWHIVVGIVSIVAGIVAFAWPGITAVAILFVIAFWSIAAGIAEIVQSFAMRRLGSASWGWMLAAGILGVVFGVLLIAWPGAGLLTLLWLLGIYAIVTGVVLVVVAVRLRGTVRAATR